MIWYIYIYIYYTALEAGHLNPKTKRNKSSGRNAKYLAGDATRNEFPLFMALLPI